MQLKRVNCGLAEVVVVRYHVGFFRILGDALHARDPRLQFIQGVKVIIAITNIRGRREPVPVIPAVQSDVAHGGRCNSHRPHGAMEDRLVDIAETDSESRKGVQDFVRDPTRMANLDYQRIFVES